MPTYILTQTLEILKRYFLSSTWRESLDFDQPMIENLRDSLVRFLVRTIEENIDLTREGTGNLRLGGFYEKLANLVRSIMKLDGFQKRGLLPD